MLNRTNARPRLRHAIGALAAASVLLGRGVPVAAQAAKHDVRWEAWLGCWKPSDATAPAPRVIGENGTNVPAVCVIPAGGRSAVDVVTVADGKIVQRTHVDADGERRSISQDGCTGWQRADWARSEFGVYLQSEISCAGSAKRTSTGLFAMSADGEWLDVQGLDASGTSGVRVLRYREAADTGTLPDEITAALGGNRIPGGTSRAVASAQLTSEDVAEASGRLGPAVVEAWLVERHQGYRLDLDAKALAKIADAGVPESVIDVLVAISYPDVFAINRATGKTELRPVEETRRIAEEPVTVTAGYPAYGYSPFGWDYYSSARCSLYGYSVFGCSPYGYSPYGFSPYGYSPFGYAPGYGWYPGNQPVVVVRGNGTPAPHGRVVNGRGYSAGGGSSTSDARPKTKTEGSSGASVKMPATSRAPASSGGGSGSSGRTAKPRP